MLKTDKIFNNSSPFTLLLKKDIDLTKKIHLLSKKEIIKLFFEAIKNGKSTKIFDILQPYIDINQCDSDGNTPLHIAVKHNRVDMVKMLINLDDIDFTLKDKDGKTAFGCAKQPEIKDLISEKLFYQLVNLILSGSIDELKAFIDLFSELDINSCGIFLQHGGVLHYAAMSTEIRNKDYLEILSFLLSLSNIDINQLNIKNGETPLHIAANHSDLKTIDKLLSAGAQANPISRYGDTPLHFACDRGHYEVVQALLLAGTDPFQKNNNEQYCFDMIANTTQKPLIKEIIRSHIFHHHFCKAVKESDADKIRHILSCVTNNLNNIKFRLNNLHFDPNETIDTKGNRALTYSAKNNDIDSVKALLFSPKTNINLKDADGKTALHYAIENKNLEIVGLLLSQQNMDITIKDPNGKSYLDLISNTSKAMKVIGVKLKDKVFETFKTSILEGNIELSKQLIEAFSKATSDSDYSIGSYSDVTGETTLDCILNPQSAVNAELFKMLLDSGADPLKKNKNGIRPIDICRDIECLPELATRNQAYVNIMDDFLFVKLIKSIDEDPGEVSALTILDGFPEMKVNFRIDRESGWTTPLHEAIRKNKVSVVEKLLKHDANPMIKNENKKNALELFDHLFKHDPNDEVRNIILNHQYSVLTNLLKQSQLNESDLHLIKASIEFLPIDFFTDKMGELLTLSNEFDEVINCIKFFARKSFVKFFNTNNYHYLSKILILNKEHQLFNIDELDKNGEIMLHMSLEDLSTFTEEELGNNHSKNAFSILMEFGANPLVKNRSGKNLFDLIQIEEAMDEVSSPSYRYARSLLKQWFIQQIKDENLENIKEVLSYQSKFIMQKIGTEKGPLDVAIESDNLDIISALIDAGAELFELDWNGDENPRDSIEAPVINYNCLDFAKTPKARKLLIDNIIKQFEDYNKKDNIEKEVEILKFAILEFSQDEFELLLNCEQLEEYHDAFINDYFSLISFILNTNRDIEKLKYLIKKKTPLDDTKIDGKTAIIREIEGAASTEIIQIFLDEGECPFILFENGDIKLPKHTLETKQFICEYFENKLKYWVTLEDLSSVKSKELFNFFACCIYNPNHFYKLLHSSNHDFPNHKLFYTFITKATSCLIFREDTINVSRKFLFILIQQLKEKFQVNFNGRLFDGNTLLHQIFQKDFIQKNFPFAKQTNWKDEFICYCLEKLHMDPSIKNKDGKNGYQLYTESGNCNEDIKLKLKKSIAQHIFYKKLKEQDLKEVERLIQSKYVDVNKEDPYGDNPLVIAIIEQQNFDLFKLLINHPNIQGIQDSPYYLINAVRGSQIEMVEILLEKGCNPLAYDCEAYTAFSECNSKDIYKLLKQKVLENFRSAENQKNKSQIQEIFQNVIEYSDDYSEVDYKHDLLNNLLCIAKELKLDINELIINNYQPLLHSIMEEYDGITRSVFKLEAIQALLLALMDTNYKLSNVDKNGETIFHDNGFRYGIEMFKLLLNYATPDILNMKNKEGYAAIELIARHEYLVEKDKFIQELINAGADPILVNPRSIEDTEILNILAATIYENITNCINNTAITEIDLLSEFESKCEEQKELFKKYIGSLTDTILLEKLDQIFELFTQRFNELKNKPAHSFNFLAILERELMIRLDLLIEQTLDYDEISPEDLAVSIKILNKMFSIIKRHNKEEEFKRVEKTLVKSRLNKAIKLGHSDLLKCLLDSKLFDVNKKENMTPPLVLAFSKNNEAIVTLLLNEDNIDPNIEIKDRPLLHALIESRPNRVLLLLDHPKIDLMAKNNQGYNAFEYSLFKNCISVVKKIWEKATKKIRQQIITDVFKKQALVIKSIICKQALQTDIDSIMHALFSEMEVHEFDQVIKANPLLLNLNSVQERLKYAPSPHYTDWSKTEPIKETINPINPSEWQKILLSNCQFSADELEKIQNFSLFNDSKEPAALSDLDELIEKEEASFKIEETNIYCGVLRLQQFIMRCKENLIYTAVPKDPNERELFYQHLSDSIGKSFRIIDAFPKKEKKEAFEFLITHLGISLKFCGSRWENDITSLIEKIIGEYLQYMALKKGIASTLIQSSVRSFLLRQKGANRSFGTNKTFKNSIKKIDGLDAYKSLTPSEEIRQALQSIRDEFFIFHIEPFVCHVIVDLVRRQLDANYRPSVRVNDIHLKLTIRNLYASLFEIGTGAIEKKNFLFEEEVTIIEQGFEQTGVFGTLINRLVEFMNSETFFFYSMQQLSQKKPGLYLSISTNPLDFFEDEVNFSTDDQHKIKKQFYTYATLEDDEESLKELSSNGTIDQYWGDAKNDFKTSFLMTLPLFEERMKLKEIL